MKGANKLSGNLAFYFLCLAALNLAAPTEASAQMIGAMGGQWCIGAFQYANKLSGNPKYKSLAWQLAMKLSPSMPKQAYEMGYDMAGGMETMPPADFAKTVKACEAKYFGPQAKNTVRNRIHCLSANMDLLF